MLREKLAQKISSLTRSKLAGVDLEKQMEMGMEVEKEHGPKGPDGGKFNVTDGSKKDTADIAAAHIAEIPNYYTLLDEMETKGKAQAKEASVIRSHLAREANLTAMEKTAGLSKRELMMLIGGAGLTGLAIPSVAQAARDAGTVAGTGAISEDLESSAAAENTNHLLSRYHRGFEPTHHPRLLYRRSMNTGHMVNTLNGAVDALNAMDNKAMAAMNRSPFAGAYGAAEKAGYGPIGAFDRAADEIGDIF